MGKICAAIPAVALATAPAAPAADLPEVVIALGAAPESGPVA